MKAKLILESGREIEMELTEEQTEQIRKETKWPREGDNEYYWLDNTGDIFDTCFLVGNDIDERRFDIGNMFRTKQEAANMVRALRLIEAVRQDRLKMNDGWKPKREDLLSYIVHGMYLGLYTEEVRNVMYANVFGFYKNYTDAESIIDKHRSELLWYFTKFLPERG